MDCNFLCSLPFRVWILILMYVCRLQEAVLKQRISDEEEEEKKGKKGDRDNVTKSACARSHKTKDQQRKTENSSMDDPRSIEMTTNIHKIPCLLIQFFH